MPSNIADAQPISGGNNFLLFILLITRRPNPRSEYWEGSGTAVTDQANGFTTVLREASVDASIPASNEYELTGTLPMGCNDSSATVLD